MLTPPARPPADRAPSDPPIPFWARFGVRLSALFLGLLLVLGVAVLALTAQSTRDAVVTADQALHLDFAAELAPRFQPHLMTDIDSVAIAEIIDGLSQVNRRIDVYLLGADGMIKSWFMDARGRPLEPFVDTAPLDRLMAGAMPPVLGPDPARPGEARPFSVAPIEIMGETGCYLYVILQGERYDDVAAALWPSALGSAAARSLVLALALTALVGVLAFWGLTRRLQRLTAAVGAFERGALTVRAREEGADEVGALSRAFNRMAARIEAQVEALRRTDRQRRDLVANVSHDLRSPLASLQGYLETLAMRPDAPADEREAHTARALHSAERLSGLVSDLFDLARFDAAEIRPRLEPTALADLAADVVADCRAEAARRDIRLNIRAQDGLPLARLDPSLVDRALGNLIGNALRHTPPGGAVEVEVSRADASALVVAVRDTGEGIAPELLPRVFDRFVRADASRAADGGAGLGLAIVKRIAALHGGTVRVESTLGAGSTFALVLPLGPRVPAPEAEEPVPVG